jgi:hypothetical protein
MSRRPSTFRQRDMTAAIKAAISAGCTVASVGINKNGTIVVVVRNGAEIPVEEQNAELDINEWDAAL